MSCRFSQNQSPIPFNWRKIGAEGTKMASGWPSTAAAHMLASICWWAVTLRTALFFPVGAPLWVGQVPKGPKTRKWQLTKAIFVNGLECTNTELMDLEGVGQNIHFSLASRTCMTFNCKLHVFIVSIEHMTSKLNPNYKLTTHTYSSVTCSP